MKEELRKFCRLYDGSFSELNAVDIDEYSCTAGAERIRIKRILKEGNTVVIEADKGKLTLPIEEGYLPSLIVEGTRNNIEMKLGDNIDLTIDEEIDEITIEKDRESGEVSIVLTSLF